MQDIFTTANKFTDKTGLFAEIIEDIMGSSFVMSKGDEVWKKTRQACAHAFYKDRMEKMCEVLKDKLATKIAGFNDSIANSSDGKVTIDLPVEFEDLFCRNIVHICFGEDVSDMLVDTEFPSPDGKGYEMKKVSLVKAIHELNRTMLGGIIFKNMNPFYQAARKLTGKKTFTEYQRVVARNAQR